MPPCLRNLAEPFYRSIVVQQINPLQCIGSNRTWTACTVEACQRRDIEYTLPVKMRVRISGMFSGVNPAKS
jgi:hypothetical protein